MHSGFLQFLFTVGSREGFGPWIAEAEKRINCRDEKPKAYDEVRTFVRIFVRNLIRFDNIVRQL
jgi:hypothetical protein